MNTPLRRHHRESALTRSELLTIVVVVIFFVPFLFGYVGYFWFRFQGRKLPDQLNNGRQIYLAMRNYAADEGHAGAFPTFREPDSKTGLFANSNEAFEVLMPRYLDDKRPFFNEKSAWCRVRSNSEGMPTLVFPGENDWVYVRGLREDSPKDWPLLANAFAPGTLHYVADPSQPGGASKGKDAIVISVGGVALIVETKNFGDTYFIPRADKPTANAFAKDGEWLAGEHVEVLYPMAPPAVK